MERIFNLFKSEWTRRSALLILLILVLHYLLQVFEEFSSVWVDSDQLLMMFGTSEFLNGRFHQPRFFGQDYGSMLESFIAMPFAGLSLELALPIATCLLWLIPYVLIVRQVDNRLNSWLLLLVWVLILPVEYAFIGTMPRDFVSGIAVTSIALVFFNGHKPVSLFLFGLFCLLGWSTNQSAALFGATITILKVFRNQNETQYRIGWIASGYLAGLLIHLTVQHYIGLHPEWIVHRAWPLSFQFDLLGKALKGLDTHWAALTPFMYRKSWIYLLILALIIVQSLVVKNRGLSLAITGLVLIVGISMGMPKIHDGFRSIFSCYERMFMALPVSVFFLVVVAKWHRRIPTLAFLMVGVFYHGAKSSDVKTRMERQTSPLNAHLLSHGKMLDVYRRMDFMENIADSLNVDVILTGPKTYNLDILAQVGHLIQDDQLRIVRPDYDRKTWFLREIDKPAYDRFLWFQLDLSAEEIEEKTGLKVTDLKIEGAEFRESGYMFLIEGKDLNPLAVYEQCGFPVCNH